MLVAVELTSNNEMRRSIDSHSPRSESPDGRQRRLLCSTLIFWLSNCFECSDTKAKPKWLRCDFAAVSQRCSPATVGLPSRRRLFRLLNHMLDELIFQHGEGAKFNVLADTCREFAPADDVCGIGRQEWLGGLAGNDKFVVDWGVGPGSSSVWRVSRCLVVGSLQRFHSYGRRDEMFFREKSKTPSIEALGLCTSVRWAEVASRRLNQSVLFGHPAVWRPGN